MKKSYGVSIKWLAVTSFEMKCNDLTVVTDPFITECAGTDLTWEAVENCDIICVSHAHYDHILGLPALKDCPIYVHEADAPAMTDAQYNCAPEATPAPCVPATHTVQDGDVISLAGIDFTVLHTPGHTLGGVCYQVNDTLFTGDTLFAHGYGRTDLYGGSFSQLMRSLRRLLRMNVHVYPGHGEDAVFSREGKQQA